MPKVPVLQDFHELVGVLDGIQLVGGGLLRVRIAGLERCMPEELAGQLRGLMRRRRSDAL